MLSRKTEDYLEAILNITEEKGYARVKNIANSLEIKPPSVVEMVKKLDKMGFVEHRKYEGVVLTPKGREVAVVVKERHNIIKSFLELIKVPEKIAENDACTMEHELDQITINQIKNLVNFVNSEPDAKRLLTQFERDYTC